MFENVGGAEILLVLIFVLIFFGPRKIPELARSLGKGMRKFNEAKSGIEGQIKTVMKEPLESIAVSRGNLEQQLREASLPLRDAVDLANSPGAPAPKRPLAPGTQPRGAAIEPGLDDEAPETPSEVPVREA